MKKILFLSFVAMAISFASCEKQQPEVSFSASNYTLSVGDSAVLEVYHAKEVDFQYSETRNADTPVFEMASKSNHATTIYALNPGTDTLWVSYGWNQGIFAYGLTSMIEIKVVE